jgi:SAM-dependent methyltransferase
MDFFARVTLGNLLRRLKRAGVKRSHAILDYGCGNGLFLQFLRQSGFVSATGYDPYVPEFASLPSGSLFDCVVANDVIEHVADPRSMIAECVTHVRPGGLLYIGTADAEGVEMSELAPHTMRLHQPFHRVIVTQQSLVKLGTASGMSLMRTYRRSYMDTWFPFGNYRFFDEFNKALGHDLDKVLDPSSAKIVVRKPSLLFYALFGYLMPSAAEPAVLLKRTEH